MGDAATAQVVNRLDSRHSQEDVSNVQNDTDGVWDPSPVSDSCHDEDCRVRCDAKEACNSMVQFLCCPAPTLQEAVSQLKDLRFDEENKPGMEGSERRREEEAPVYLREREGSVQPKDGQSS